MAMSEITKVVKRRKGSLISDNFLREVQNSVVEIPHFGEI